MKKDAPKSTKNKSEKPEKREPMEVCEVAGIITRANRFARDASGALFVFHSGCYRPGGENLIRTQVKSVLWTYLRLNQWSTSLTNEVVEFIRVDAPLLWTAPPLDFLNVQNGILEIETRTLHPHSPDYLSAIQLPITYDPTARPPSVPT